MSDGPTLGRFYEPPMTLLTIDKSALRINDDHGDLMVEVFFAGRIEYGPTYDPDEAARTFWAAIAAHFPAGLA